MQVHKHLSTFIPNHPPTRIMERLIGRSSLCAKNTKGWRATGVRRPALAKPQQAPVSYPHPPERQTSRLRLLPPGPGQVHPTNTETASLQRQLHDRQPQGTDTHCKDKRSPTHLDTSAPAVSPSYRGFTVRAKPLRGPLTLHLRLATQNHIPHNKH